MCGIGAFQLAVGDGNPRRLAQALLRELVVRGSHASGCAWHDDSTGQTYIQKRDIAGPALAKQLDSEIGRTCIVHTRYATQGHPSNNLNNHPLDVRGIVGVHNGHINNDDELIAKCGDYQRQGIVDSEAAFAYIMHGQKKQGGLLERLSHIRGGAALMWLNTNGKSKYLHIARLSTSPLVLGKSTKGSVVLASTRHILERACKEGGITLASVTELAEGTYIRFKDGQVDQMGDIPMPPKPATRWTEYEWNRNVTSATPKVGSGSYSDGRYLTQMELFLQETNHPSQTEIVPEFDDEDNYNDLLLDLNDAELEAWLKAEGDR